MKDLIKKLLRRTRKRQHASYFTEHTHGLFVGKNGIPILLNNEQRESFINGGDVYIDAHLLEMQCHQDVGAPAYDEIAASLRRAADVQLLTVFQILKGLGCREIDILSWFELNRPHLKFESRIDNIRRHIPKWTTFGTAREFNKEIRSNAKRLYPLTLKSARQFEAAEEIILCGLEIFDALEKGLKRVNEMNSQKREMAKSLRNGSTQLDPKELKVYSNLASEEPPITDLIFMAAFAGIDPTELWLQFSSFHGAPLRAISRFCQILRVPEIELELEHVHTIRAILANEPLNGLPSEHVQHYSDIIMHWINSRVGGHAFASAARIAIENKTFATIKAAESLQKT